MKNMFRLMMVCCLVSGASYAQLKTPAPSPTQTVKQDFALSSVELSYSRPAVKGRKVFGDLVPYGKVWRTGANRATTITFGEDVMFGGKNVPAGKYGLLTIPGASEWTVILSKQLDVTAPAAYKEDMDVARVKAKPMKMPMTVESFTIGFDDVKSGSMKLYLLWDKTYVEVPVTADIDSKVMAQINEQMNGDSEKKPYFPAAMYYLENGKDLNQALAWFDKAVEENPDAFYMHHHRARCLAKLGKKQEALATAQKSIELSKKAKSDDYVALNEKLIASLK
ncbi:MAG TPA: DUF2911 domain-containing protein [Chitinophagaceae bacterium]|nr:DUF2911 domain-containing protein [Chitinophagaceae bacterium]